jgi:hypothetical protein
MRGCRRMSTAETPQSGSVLISQATMNLDSAAVDGACSCPALQQKSVPVAPHQAPCHIFQDRNMPLTWQFGAPGRIRTRDPLLRRCHTSVQGGLPRGQMARMCPDRTYGVQACWCHSQVSAEPGGRGPMDARSGWPGRDGSCGGDLFFRGWTAGRPGHGVIAIDHGLLPTLVGFPGWRS